MPKIEITDDKGLVQKSGSGVVFQSSVVLQSSGLEGVVVSAETTLPAAQGNTDIELELPAGALVTDFGFVVTSAVGGGGAGSTMTVSVGTDVGEADLVAAVTVVAATKTAEVGTSMSVLNGVVVQGDSAPFGDFVDASVLHSSAARSIHARFAQGAGAAAAAGKVIAFVKYIIIA